MNTQVSGPRGPQLEGLPMVLKEAALQVVQEGRRVIPVYNTEEKAWKNEECANDTQEYTRWFKVMKAVEAYRAISTSEYETRALEADAGIVEGRLSDQTKNQLNVIRSRTITGFVQHLFWAVPPKPTAGDWDISRRKVMLNEEIFDRKVHEDNNEILTELKKLDLKNFVSEKNKQTLDKLSKKRLLSDKHESLLSYKTNKQLHSLILHLQEVHSALLENKKININIRDLFLCENTANALISEQRHLSQGRAPLPYLPELTQQIAPQVKALLKSLKIKEAEQRFDSACQKLRIKVEGLLTGNPSDTVLVEYITDCEKAYNELLGCTTDLFHEEEKALWTREERYALRKSKEDEFKATTRISEVEQKLIDSIDAQLKPLNIQEQFDCHWADPSNLFPADPTTGMSKEIETIYNIKKILQIPYLRFDPVVKNLITKIKAVLRLEQIIRNVHDMRYISSRFENRAEPSMTESYASLISRCTDTNARREPVYVKKLQEMYNVLTRELEEKRREYDPLFKKINGVSAKGENVTIAELEETLKDIEITSKYQSLQTFHMGDTVKESCQALIKGTKR